MGVSDGSGGSGGKGGGQSQGGGEPEAASLETDVGPELSPEVIEGERAEGAETGSKDRVDELLAEVAALRGELADAKSAAEKAGRRAEIEGVLTAAGAIDLEITTPLVEDVLGSMENGDVGKAVREVRASKRFLFRATGGGGSGRGSVMAGQPAGGGVGLEDLAGDAKSSGDRSDLLRYLRARRG